MFRLVAIVACLLSAAYGYSLRPAYNDNGASILYHDDTLYNPCDASSGVFFYPHQNDRSQYYQCDESDNVYPRSCGNLVWDDLIKTCNWPSVVPSDNSQFTTTVAPFPSTTIPTSPITLRPLFNTFWSTLRPQFSTFWPTFPSRTTETTTKKTPSFTWPTWTWWTSTPVTPVSTTGFTFPTQSTTTTTTTTTTTPFPDFPDDSSSSTTESTVTETDPDSAAPSLCETQKPCGEHGDCIESPSTVPVESRRFACLCDDGWFGQVCDKRIDGDLTTPSSSQELPRKRTKRPHLPNKDHNEARKLAFESRKSATTSSKTITSEEFDRMFA